MEILNGKDVDTYVNNLRDWLAVLRFAPGGRLPVATANSDSHRLVVDQAGFPVTAIRSATPLASWTDATIEAAFDAGAMTGAGGVFVWALGGETGMGVPTIEPGRTPVRAPSGDVTLHVTVRAAPWVPVEEIRVRVGGTVVQRITGASLAVPADPFGTAGVLRYEGDVMLTGLTADTFVVVEAGFPLARVADVNGDGTADATDRDGDGDIDADDVTMGGIAFGAVPMPYGVIATGGRPVGFTNPIYVDVNGDGDYDAPGTPLVD